MKKASDVLAHVKKAMGKQGIRVRWYRPVTETNSRGVPVVTTSADVVNARVLLLRKPYNPLAGTDIPIEPEPDRARYVLALPETPIARDTVIQHVSDTSCVSWRLDVPESFIMGSDEAFIQAPLDRTDTAAPIGKPKTEPGGKPDPSTEKTGDENTNQNSDEDEADKGGNGSDGEGGDGSDTGDDDTGIDDGDGDNLDDDGLNGDDISDSDESDGGK